MSVVKNIEIENQNYDIYGKNIQPVTWQEYEAIEDKNDDKAYFITDVPPSEQKKTAVKPLPTGAISTVTDAASLPLNALKVSVEAVQDLHGYDHPWAGGAGKNKLPLVLADIKTLNTSGTWSGDEYTISGVTFTILTDSNGNVTGVSVNGTATKNITFLLTNTNGSWMTDGTTYKINGSVGGSYNTWSIWVQGHGTYQSEMSLDGDGTFTYTAGRSTSARISVDSGVSLSNQMFRPMIRLATESDPTFEPYSNICPIEGWDSGEINVVGKNWAKYDNANNPNRSGYSYSEESAERTVCTKSTSGGLFVLQYLIYLREGETYCFYFDNYTYDNVSQNDADVYIYSNGLWGSLIAHLGVEKTGITWTSSYTGTAVLGIFTTQSAGTEIVFEKLMISKGSTATTYEPYQSITRNVDFGSTIYGGTLDVTSGVLTVDKGYATLPSEGWSHNSGWNNPSTFVNGNNILSGVKPVSGYDGRANAIVDAVNIDTPANIAGYIGRVGIGIGNGTDVFISLGESYDTSEKLGTYLTNNPIHICYELATPQTYQLTPAQVRMLQGTNNLYADCGEVIEGEYFGNNTNQIRVNDEIIAGGNSVTFAAESKYAEHAEVAEVANNIQNIDYNDYDAIADKDNDIAYIVNDVPSSESGSNYFKDLPTGSIATVNDAAELPLNALKISVEAQQDLHGYDHPWVGGAGKNKLPLVLADIKANNIAGTWNGNVYTNNGITYTFWVDNANNITGLNISGTATSDGAGLDLVKNASYPFNGTYIISGGDRFNPYTTAYDIRFADSSYNTLVYSSDVEKAISSNLTQYGLFIWPGITVNKTIYPMIRLATETDPTFAPYSNICPIDGLDSGEISVVGKNLFNDSEVTTGKVLNYQTGMLVNNSDYYTSDFVSVTSGNQYTFSGVCKLITAEQWWYDENKQPLQVASTNATKTVPNGACYFRFSNKIVNGYIGQIEIGNQATTYEPYQGNQYTQQFPQTIYGAEWDVVNGDMKLIKNKIVFDGSEDWRTNGSSGVWIPASSISGFDINYPIKFNKYIFTFTYGEAPAESGYADYNANRNAIQIRDERAMTGEAFKTLLQNEPLEMEYYLLTPQTIDLSPLSIRMLQGVNNIYADCGEVIEGEYCINTSNQLCINDKVVSGDRMVPQSLVSKYSDYSTHADKADDSTHADIADNACTFSVDENGLLTISLVSGDSNNSLSSTRSVKSITILPPEEEITNEKSEEEEIKDKSVEEEPSENESEITDETENAPSVEEEKDNDDGGEETAPEQNIR